MEMLINIKDQQFLEASVEELNGFCAENNCAIVIDEFNLEKLIDSGIKTALNKKNQLIIISENVNQALSVLVGVEVLLVAASNLNQAIKLAIDSAEMNKNVLCVVQDPARVIEITNEFI